MGDKQEHASGKLTSILIDRLNTAFNMMISRDRMNKSDQSYDNSIKINSGKLEADSNSLSAIIDGLKFSYEDIQGTTSSNRKLLAQKITTVEIMEKELENAEDTLDTYKKSQNNKYKSIQTNTYYQKSFSNKIYTSLYFILFCALLIGLVLLNKRNILKDPYYKIVMIPFIMIGSLFLIYKIINLYLHDNMVYNKSNWLLSGSVPTGMSIWKYNKKNLFGKIKNAVQDPQSYLDTCVNGTCCDKGTIWDTYTKECVVNHQVVG